MANKDKGGGHNKTAASRTAKEKRQDKKDKRESKVEAARAADRKA